MSFVPRLAPVLASSVVSLLRHPGFTIKQRREGFELLGVETPNAYDILGMDGRRVLRVAEREGGFWGIVGRQLGGHGAAQFELDVVDERGTPVLHLSHPPRFFLQRIEVRSGRGRLLGWFEQCFTLADRKFHVHDAYGRVLFTASAGLFSSRTFPFVRPTGRRVATLKKEWSGLASEMFTDADDFRLVFESQSLGPDERALLLAAAIFIDLTWFEQNGAE